jgi:hypothetical protein
VTNCGNSSAAVPVGNTVVVGANVPVLIDES